MGQTTLQPGFRFHPTDDELISYYLKRKVMGKSFRIEAISEVDIYKFAPWDLPAKSPLKSRDLEWFFFCPRDRKYGKSSRRSRCNDIGYWKTTGKDRPILHNNHPVGMKKTLIFHRGKAPRGDRTDWVMYEYRLEDQKLENTEYSQGAYAICKIFKKSGPGPKNGEQYGAPFYEEEWEDDEDLNLACSSVRASSSRELSNGHIIHQSLVSGGGEMPSLPELPDTDGTIPDAEFLRSSSLPSAVGTESSLHELPDVDRISLDLLAEFLNISPLHSDIGTEMSHSVILPENGDGLSDLVTEGIHELDGLSGQVEPSPMDGISLSDIRDIEFDSQPVELYDRHLLENNNTPELLMPNYTLANNSFIRHSGEAEMRPPSGSSFSDFRNGEFGYHSMISDLNKERFLELNDFNLFEEIGPKQLMPHYTLGDQPSHYPSLQNETNVSNFAGMTSGLSVSLSTDPNLPLIPAGGSAYYPTFQNMNGMSNDTGVTFAFSDPLPDLPVFSSQSFSPLEREDRSSFSGSNTYTNSYHSSS